MHRKLEPGHLGALPSVSTVVVPLLPSMSAVVIILLSSVTTGVITMLPSVSTVVVPLLPSVSTVLSLFTMKIRKEVRSKFGLHDLME